MSNQVHETTRFAIFLAISGGFQDAYTYHVRQKVFANAQTGNIVLMMSHFFNGQWQKGLIYIFPLMAFACGIIVAQYVQLKYQHTFHRYTLFFIMTILACVAFIPVSQNTLANCLVSFSCALQVQAFQKIKTYTYASTMCIGNLKSAMAALGRYIFDQQSSHLHMALHYLWIIFCFGIGAGLGSLWISPWAILISPCILLFPLYLTFQKHQIAQ